MSTTQANSHRTGTVASGDVEIFYRHFGSASEEAPILILHGAGYYDSADWVQVAAELAADGREVVAFDARGYGRSSWSPSADYSLDAQLSDIAALTGHLGWERPVLLGHSRGGSFTLRYAHALPDRVGAAIFADSCPGRTARGPAPVRAGGATGAAAEQPVYATLADALASTSRDPSSLERPAARARLEEFFTRAPGGYVLSARDPRFQSNRPVDQPDWHSRLRAIDPWPALAGLRVPTLIIRATRSQSFDAASVARVHSEASHARYVEIDSDHDLANQAPAALVAAVRQFLGLRRAQSASHSVGIRFRSRTL